MPVSGLNPLAFTVRQAYLALGTAMVPVLLLISSDSVHLAVGSI